MHLMPLYFAQFGEQGDLEMCNKFNVMSCVECGTCAYICPGSVPIVQFVRMTKGKINEEKRRQQALAAAAEAEKAKKEEEKK